MKAVISPLYYLPPIHCMAAYVQCERLIIEASENYQKGSFRNKCIIGTSQGALTLSIPLLRGKHQSLDIRNVKISNAENWQRQHLRSVRTAYSNAPFFEHYCYRFEPLWQRQYKLLWELNMDMFKVIQNCLNLELKYDLTESYKPIYEEGTTDLRKIKRPFQKIKPYPQVTDELLPFQQDLSILDLIFHLGPEAPGYLKSLQIE